jgi:hypothetical protein
LLDVQFQTYAVYQRAMIVFMNIEREGTFLPKVGIMWGVVVIQDNAPEEVVIVKIYRLESHA